MIAISKKIGMVVLVAQCFFLLNGMPPGDEQQAISLSQPVNHTLKPRRLGIYCDNHQGEAIFGKSGVVANSLAQALHQNASAIIVSESVFYSCITRLMGIDDFFKNVVFVPSDWEIYYINESSYFLLLPLKNKLRAVTPYEDRDRSDVFGEYAIFNKQVMTQFTQESLPELKGFIEANAHSATRLKGVLSRLFTTVQSLVKTPLTLPSATNNAEKKDLTLTAMRPWNIYLLGHGNTNKAIAGLDPDDFNAVLSFFNTAININFVLVSSCFVAGENQLFMTHTNNLVQESVARDLRYKLAISGSSQGSIIKMSFDHLDKPDKSVDCDAFFVALEKQDSDSIETALSYLTLPGDWYFNICGVNSIPQILLPRVGWTQVFTAMPQVDILTETKLKKHSIEKENSYDIHDVLAVVVKPQEVNTRLRVSSCSVVKKPYWLALQWGHLLEVNYRQEDNGSYTAAVQSDFYNPIFMCQSEGPFLKVLDEVTVLEKEPLAGLDNCVQKNGVLRFLRDSFLNVQLRTQPVCWHIKKLTGFNDFTTILAAVNKPGNDSLLAQLRLKQESEIILYDVVVCAYSDSSSPIIAMLMFKYNGIFYCMEDAAINPLVRSDNTDSAWVFTQLNEQEFNEKIKDIDQKIIIKANTSDHKEVGKKPYLALVGSLKKNDKSCLVVGVSGGVGRVVDPLSVALANKVNDAQQRSMDKSSKSELVMTPVENSCQKSMQLLNFLKTKLEVLVQSLKQLKKSLAALNDKVISCISNTDSTTTMVNLSEQLRMQEEHKARCVSIINEWAGGAEISEKSIIEYFKEVSFLSEKQTEFLVPLAVRELSEVQKKSFSDGCESLREKKIPEFEQIYNDSTEIVKKNFVAMKSTFIPSKAPELNYRSECLAMINTWYTQSKISKADVQLYFEKIFHLSDAQKIYIVSFAEKTLSESEGLKKMFKRCCSELMKSNEGKIVYLALAYNAVLCRVYSDKYLFMINTWQKQVEISKADVEAYAYLLSRVHSLEIFFEYIEPFCNGIAKLSESLKKSFMHSYNALKKEQSFKITPKITPNVKSFLNTMCEENLVKAVKDIYEIWSKQSEISKADVDAYFQWLSLVDELDLVSFLYKHRPDKLPEALKGSFMHSYDELKKDDPAKITPDVRAYFDEMYGAYQVALSRSS